MEVPRLGVKSELQLPATATATQDPNFCYLYHSWWQHQILNPLREAGDQTGILMIRVGFVTTKGIKGTPQLGFFFLKVKRNKQTKTMTKTSLNSLFCAEFPWRPLSWWLRAGWVALSPGISPSFFVLQAREQPLLSTVPGSILSLWHLGWQ